MLTVHLLINSAPDQAMLGVTLVKYHVDPLRVLRCLITDCFDHLL